MTKAEQKFRIVWENDIPICKRVESDIQWRDIPWKKLERRVFKLQKRIYQASNRGDVKVVRKLQKTLLRSWSAKCIAVRRVTQDNKGKKTAGVDGIKSLSPEARLKLVKRLKPDSKSRPTRRVWIPKPGTEEKRPLGIPTMYDRALQALVKVALEPEWEARFEPNSYGFRPGRGAHDAIEAIFLAIRYKPKYVLDADIAKCFDRINHDALLTKVNTFPTLRRQIKAWLKSGVIDSGQISQTTEGTPQGGVISPLLANIALHGMENRIKQFAETFPGRKRENRKALSLIRYADDFVILHEKLEVIHTCQQIIADWLRELGLELKPSKTKISHTLNQINGNCGFKFLGFQVKQVPVGICHTGKFKGKALGFKTLITPGKEEIKSHAQKTGKLIEKLKPASQEVVIAALNPIIRGWANYYATSECSKVFSKLDEIIFRQLWSWATRRHPNKNKQWIRRKYWKTVGENNWTFATDNDSWILNGHIKVGSIKHVKVQDTRSPYDGDWIYWVNRMGKHPLAPTKLSKLLEEQKGKCAHCGHYFKDGDKLEIDHIIPRQLGGKDKYENYQILHRHCHDVKSAEDLKTAKGMYDKHQFIEEPDEVKVSCPVLKTSQWGDSLA
jgi:RNA-directed DNA polymerase